MRSLSLAALQLDLQEFGNAAAIVDEVRTVKARFPFLDLIVIGELAPHGVSPRRAEPAGGPFENLMCETARALSVWLVPGSYYETSGSLIYNTAPVINPDGDVVARYRKMFPFLPYEQGIEPGSDFVVFDIPGAGRIGLSICYDMWFPETTRTLAWMGAELIIHPSLTNTIDRDTEIAIARASAASNQCYFVDVNLAGRLGVGRSCIFGPGGEPVHIAGTSREIMVFDLDLDLVSQVRERGWHGLGQTLKSFRDADISFPPYQKDAGPSLALKKLGPLEKPAGKGAPAHPTSTKARKA